MKPPADEISSMKNFKQNSTKGFTLIELLVVIGILAVLLAITLIAINPARQFAQANNTKRSSDVSAILNAVGQYAVEHHGDLSAINIPVGTSSAKVIGSNAGAGELDFCPNIVPTYIAAMPVDPTNGDWTDCNSYTSGYTIFQEASNHRITVTAPHAELNATITVTR